MAQVAAPTNGFSVDIRPQGDVWVVQPGESGKPGAVFYRAPEEQQEPFSTTLEYTEGASRTKVEIVVGAAPPAPAAAAYEESFRILFALLVLAVLMESGLAVLFNWRVYQSFFAVGVKTPVTVGFAVLLVYVFRLDLATTLVNLYTGAHFAPGPAGTILTALILAGGSSGVNRILVALGFRKERPPEEVRPKPLRTEGWLSVRYVGSHAGPLTVLIGDPTAPNAVGEISSNRSRGRFAQLFLRDGSRFPSGGGYSYDAEKLCRVELRDRTGQPIPHGAWGPYPVGPGAIIDIEFG